jgi:hypothetical protein
MLRSMFQSSEKKAVLKASESSNELLLKSYDITLLSCRPRSSSFRYSISNLYFLPLFQFKPQLISPASTFNALKPLKPSNTTFFCSHVYVCGGSCQLILRLCSSAPTSHFPIFFIPFFTSVIRASASMSPGLLFFFSFPRWRDKWICFRDEVTSLERIKFERRVLCFQRLKSIFIKASWVGAP